MGEEEYMEEGFIPIVQGVMPRNRTQLGQIPMAQPQQQAGKKGNAGAFGTIAKLAKAFSV